MSEATNNESKKIDLETISPELRKVIEFDEVPEQMFEMVTSIHEVSEEAVRASWDEMPASAQNILGQLRAIPRSSICWSSFCLPKCNGRIPDTKSARKHDR